MQPSFYTAVDDFSVNSYLNSADKGFINRAVKLHPVSAKLFKLCFQCRLFVLGQFSGADDLGGRNTVRDVAQLFEIRYTVRKCAYPSPVAKQRDKRNYMLRDFAAECRFNSTDTLLSWNVGRSKEINLLGIFLLNL